MLSSVISSCSSMSLVDGGRHRCPDSSTAVAHLSLIISMALEITETIASNVLSYRSNPGSCVICVVFVVEFPDILPESACALPYFCHEVRPFEKNRALKYANRRTRMNSYEKTNTRISLNGLLDSAQALRGLF